MPTDLATHSSAQYNFITPNLCHDGHEGVSPCSAFESADNTLRSDTWLKQNVPLILESAEYQEGGALFIIWDEAEDNGPFSDGPIGMFLLSPFAKGGGKRPYPAQNTKALVPMETCTRRFRRAELAGLNVDVQFIRDSLVVLPMAPEGPTRR